MPFAANAQTRRAPVKPAVRAAVITPADIRGAAIAAGLKIQGSRVLNGCDEPVEAPERKDLNKDGQPELIFGDGICEGGNAGWFAIAVRTSVGMWRQVLSSQGVYKILSNRRQGWPDIQVGGPGCEGSDPKYSWNGNKYVVSGQTPRSCTVEAKEKVSVVTKPDPNPLVSLFDSDLSICSNNSNNNCDLIIGPQFAMYADPNCQYSKLPIYTCADSAIRLADAKGLNSFYIAYFERGMPQMRNAGVLPLDRFYRVAYIEKNKKGEWRLKGPTASSGLQRCPDYGLSSLHVRQVTGLPTNISVARFVKCDIANNGEFSYRDAALTEDPPFFRPGTTADSSRQQTTAASSTYAAPTAVAVWSLGRARILAERAGNCGPDDRLGKAYCFDGAKAWLRRRPHKRDVDVIAIDQSYMIGSLVPYNSGQGWAVYNVARNGEAFTADKQRHFATKIPMPLGCRYQGVLQRAWYITIAGGRRVAVEAEQYACAGWGGQPLYTRGVDYAFVDAGQLEYAGLAVGDRSLQQQPVAPQNTYSSESSTFGVITTPRRRMSDDSTKIYGEPSWAKPATPRQPPRKKAK
ncbi:hypothetical protein [Sphingomonas sp.]|uniref:hypothetical protein n=1 Tax=Sphingomonas sp. TaxID=28214 RepID=UPI0035BBBE98